MIEKVASEGRRELELPPLAPTHELVVNPQVLHVMTRIALVTGQAERTRDVERGIAIDLDPGSMTALVSRIPVPRVTP